MKKEDLKIIVSISISMSVIIGCLYIFFLHNDLNFSNIIRGMSFGLSTTTFFWTFYFSFGWRWPLFKLIFYRPNLNGTWSGTLMSDWVNDNGEPIKPKTFHIVIRQSFLRIHFRTYTDTFVGVSYAETLSLKKDQGLKNIAYLFRKETSQENDETLHEGATELRLIESTVRRLEGKYWSNKKTNGKILVEFVSLDHVDSFEDAAKLKKK